MKELDPKYLDKINGGTGSGPFSYEILHFAPGGGEETYVYPGTFEDEDECIDAMIRKGDEIDASGGYVIQMHYYSVNK